MVAPEALQFSYSVYEALQYFPTSKLSLLQSLMGHWQLYTLSREKLGKLVYVTKC